MSIAERIAELRAWVRDSGHAPTAIAAASGGSVSRPAVYLALSAGPWNPVADTLVGLERARGALGGNPPRPGAELTQKAA